MNAFCVDAYAHAKLKSLLGSALPDVKSSHRAEAIARGFGFATNAALLAHLRRCCSVTMHPVRFEEYLVGKGWTVRGSVFVGSCFGLRPFGLDSLNVPRWGAALVDGEWVGLILWEGRLARAEISVPGDVHGPTWLAGVNLSGIPLSLFRGEGDALSQRFEADAMALLGYPAKAIQPRGEFRDLGPYLGGEPFPHEGDGSPSYEIFGASSIPVSPTPEECRIRRKLEHAAGWYAGLISY